MLHVSQVLWRVILHIEVYCGQGAERVAVGLLMQTRQVCPTRRALVKWIILEVGVESS